MTWTFSRLSLSSEEEILLKSAVLVVVDQENHSIGGFSGIGADI